MLQLRPTETFTIVRVLDDPNDTNTYYVQAVIKNSRTEVVIDTINLTDQGSRRFTGEWEVAADVGGEGFYIDITNTVYNDSGYTDDATNYAEVNDTYLVQDRMNANLGGHGGGYEISPKAFREIVNSEITNRKMVEFEQVDLTPVMGRIALLEERVGGIVIPEPEKLDITPTLKEIVRIEKEIKNAIDNKPVTPLADLSPIVSSNTQENTLTESKINEMFKVLRKELKEELDKVKEFISKTNDRFDLSDKLKGFFNELPNKDSGSFSTPEKPKKKRLFLNR